MNAARKIKVAIIGAGWYAAENHIPVLARRDDVVLDGVSRLGAAELVRVKEAFGFAAASEDYRDMLARKPDAVIVASPHHLHFEHARAAIAGGAHVLCEKPLTLDPREGWELVGLAARHQRHLVVANGHHYLPRLNEIRTLIRDGAVGRIEHVACQFVSATRAVFSGAVGLARWQSTFFRPDRATWQDPARGGGFAYGQLSHSIALLLWLTGLTPRDVAAQTFSLAGVDLCNAAVMGFDGGAVGTVAGAAAMPEGQRPLLRLLVTGSEGVFDIALDRDRAELCRHDGKILVIAPDPGTWVYRCDGPPNALIDLAHGHSINLAPGDIAAATVATIAAMLHSARNGGAPAQIERAPASVTP
jgi:predicted dehydrogenase